MTFEIGTFTVICKRDGVIEVGTITKTASSVLFNQKLGIAITETEMIDIGTHMNTLTGYFLLLS